MGMTRGIFVAAGLLVALFAGQSIAQEKRGVGGFDIGKVAELSAAQETEPAADSEASEKTVASSQNYTVVILRIIGSLALIVVLVFAVSWIVKKSGITGGGRRIGGGGSMEVLEAVSLGPNRNVVLLRVMETVYVCGATPSSIDLIDKMEGQRVADLMAAGKGSASVVQFKDAFNHFLSRMKR